MKTKQKSFFGVVNMECMFCNCKYLYAISDIQIIQSLKSATINFFDTKQKNDFILILYIENIVLFRDTLITKMKALDIKVSIKIIDSNSEKNEKRRITMKDMSKMNLVDIEKHINDRKQSIDKGEIDEYSINTFTTLCGKAIEELDKSFNKEDEKKLKKYEKYVEDVYRMEKVEGFNECQFKNKNIELDINKDKNEEKKEINIIEENKNDINSNINDKNEKNDININKTDNNIINKNESNNDIIKEKDDKNENINNDEKIINENKKEKIENIQNEIKDD